MRCRFNALPGKTRFFKSAHQPAVELKGLVSSADKQKAGSRFLTSSERQDLLARWVWGSVESAISHPVSGKRKFAIGQISHVTVLAFSRRCCSMPRPPRVLRISRAPHRAEGDFILLHISQDGPSDLDLKLIATEGTTPYVGAGKCLGERGPVEGRQAETRTSEARSPG